MTTVQLSCQNSVSRMSKCFGLLLNVNKECIVGQIHPLRHAHGYHMCTYTYTWLNMHVYLYVCMCTLPTRPSPH